MSLRSQLRALVVLAAALCIAVAAPAHAAFPGTNGILAWSDAEKILGLHPGNPTPQVIVEVPGATLTNPAWSADGESIAFEHHLPGVVSSIWVADADGTGATPLTPGPDERDPSWSPDGQRLVFVDAGTGDRDLWVMDADGSNPTQLTFTPGRESDPEWSPDGQKIAYTFQAGAGPQVMTIDPDGTDATLLTPGSSPDWSPFGDELVFIGQRDALVHRIAVGGTGTTPLTETGSGWPAFSPDGMRVAFERCCVDLYTTGYAGGWPEAVASPESLRTRPAWQPLPTTVFQKYVRPKGATPLRVPLVPAFRPCESPDREHGPPLAFGSCAAHAQTSSTTTVGTPDANGAAANFEGAVRYAVVVGNPSTPADEADVSVTVDVTDVRLRANNADYPVPLEIFLSLSITDRDTPALPLTLTSPPPETAPFYTWPLRLPVPCATNSDPSIGSSCSVSTTLDAVLPGSTPEGRRSVWGLDQVHLYDSGGDGDVSTTDDNEVFAVQGLFVP